MPRRSINDHPTPPSQVGAAESTAVDDLAANGASFVVTSTRATGRRPQSTPTSTLWAASTRSWPRRACPGPWRRSAVSTWTPSSPTSSRVSVLPPRRTPTAVSSSSSVGCERRPILDRNEPDRIRATDGLRDEHGFPVVTVRQQHLKHEVDERHWARVCTLDRLAWDWLLVQCVWADHAQHDADGVRQHRELNLLDEPLPAVGT